MFTPTRTAGRSTTLGVCRCTACAAHGAALRRAFGLKAFGGTAGSASWRNWAAHCSAWDRLAGGYAVYGALKKLVGIRLDAEEEFNGADLSIHRIYDAGRESGWWDGCFVPTSYFIEARSQGACSAQKAASLTSRRSSARLAARTPP